MEDLMLALTAKGQDNARLWHRRMGHLGIDNLKRLRNAANGIDFSDSFGTDCQSCILANQTRSPRSGKTSGLTNRPNQLIHTDLSGPQDVQSLQGNHYLMTVIDDYTRRVTLYFLKQKSDAIGYMKESIIRAAVEGNPVLGIRLDNGGEYTNLGFLSYLKQQGILNEPTVPYSPESNGVAERMNRTIMSKVHAMMKDSQLPRFLWESLAAMAAYLHNRSPSRPLSWMTPFEKHTGNKPDLSHL